ncbi:ATP-binding protein, partial [bacterium]
MNSALSARLQQARHRLFVGRPAELASWLSALDSTEWEIPIWHVHGLGGMGKTSLLREWKRAAQERGVRVVTLDARDFEPTVEAIGAVLREQLNETFKLDIEPSAKPTELGAALDKVEGRLVIQIDTYELLAPVDDWLRENFLPQLPANVAINLAGRNPLPLPWHSDSGWQELLRSFDLGALTVDESCEYLQRRGIAGGARTNLLSWAHGHPLALSLAADVWLQKPLEEQPDLGGNSGGDDFRPGDVPQLVGSLLGHLISEVPTKAHRAALEACATVAVMSEELLADMLAPLPGVDFEATSSQTPSPDIRALFEWLRSLSVIQANRFGLFPHDLAREVLVADLRWRNPQWHAQLHSSAREHYLRQIHQATGGEQQRAIFDCLFLHRMSPAVAPYLQWNDSRCVIEVARQGDVETCLQWVGRHEGAESKRLAAHWFALQPENLIVIRSPGGQPQGFVFQ